MPGRLEKSSTSGQIEHTKSKEISKVGSEKHSSSLRFDKIQKGSVETEYHIQGKDHGDKSQGKRSYSELMKYEDQKDNEDRKSKKPRVKLETIMQKPEETDQYDRKENYENNLHQEEKEHREEAKNILNDMYKKVLDKKGINSDGFLIKDTKNLYAFEYKKDNINYTILVNSPEAGEQALRKLGLEIKDGELNNLEAGKSKEGVKKLKFDGNLVKKLKGAESVQFSHPDGSTTNWARDKHSGEMSEIHHKADHENKKKTSMMDLLLKSSNSDQSEESEESESKKGDKWGNVALGVQALTMVTNAIGSIINGQVYPL